MDNVDVELSALCATNGDSEGGVMPDDISKLSVDFKKLRQELAARLDAVVARGCVSVVERVTDSFTGRREELEAKWHLEGEPALEAAMHMETYFGPLLEQAVDLPWSVLAWGGLSRAHLQTANGTVLACRSMLSSGILQLKAVPARIALSDSENDATAILDTLKLYSSTAYKVADGCATLSGALALILNEMEKAQ